MSLIDIGNFQRKYGSMNDLTPLENSKYLFLSNNKKTLIYKLEIKKDEQESKVKEIKLQNNLNEKQKQIYPKIVDYTFVETLSGKTVYMTKEINVEGQFVFLCYEEIKENIIKLMLFKKTLKLLMDIEQSENQIFYIDQKNIFYYEDQLYLTIFGCTKKFNNRIPQSLQQLSEQTKAVCNIQYKNENNEEKQNKISNYKKDLLQLFQEMILNINSQEISIQQIYSNCNSQELKNMAKILIEFMFNDNSSIEMIHLRLQESNELQQINQKVVESWENYNQNLQGQSRNPEAIYKQILLNGSSIQYIKELEADQLAAFIKYLKDQFQNQSELNKQTTTLILQAQFRQQALDFIQNQSQAPHPNLIYLLKENELEKLKNDQSLQKQLNKQNQQIQEMITNYQQVLYILSSFLLDQEVLQLDQLKLIPIKSLQTSLNQKIQKFCNQKQLEMQMNNIEIEPFEFEYPLQARYKYEQFLLAINKKESNQNENPLDHKLSFEQFTTLDEQRKKNYITLILNKIQTLRKSSNQDDKVKLQNYINALHESFQKIDYQYIRITGHQQLYKEQQDALDIGSQIIFYIQNNTLEFSVKLFDFFKLNFTEKLLIDQNYGSYLRQFERKQISNYFGNLLNEMKHGLGLRKVNENHLQFGIFSFDKQIWGWEIILQSNIISFYKGPFLDEQKHGLGVQNKYDFQTKDPKPIEEFEGQFQKNKREGQGLLKILGQNITYQGDFKNDKLNGFASQFQDNKPIFCGYFTNGLKNGLGQEINEKENFQSIGKYEDDKCIGNHTQIRDGVTTIVSYQSSTCYVF